MSAGQIADLQPVRRRPHYGWTICRRRAMIGA
jgi:hypothetical protein